jgi:rfaE bifunctional protein nucleotidyltransferase chain/domain
MGSVLSLDELKKTLEDLRGAKKRIVTTNGCFDLLHLGHVRILKQARALGDVLVIGLNSDYSVRRIKGDRRPIVSEKDRAEVLSSLGCVDYVTIFNEDTPTEFLKAVKPDIHVKGSDYTSAQLAETPIVEAGGGKVVIIKLVPDKSTTDIIERIKAT